MQEQTDEAALMRDYLLGELDEEHQELVETRLLSDEDFAERLYATQNNLIDDYVFGVLSERERERFETDFILTEERRKKILISQALRSYVSRGITYPPTLDEYSHVPPTRWRNTLQFLGEHKASAVISLAVALLLVFVAPKVVKLLKENDHLASLQTQRARIERQVAELNKHPLDTLTQEHNTLELVLQPAMLREGGEMKKAVITKDVKILSLKLALSPRRYESYHALMLTDDDKELFAVSDLTTDVDGAVILLKIPAEFLPTGDYQVVLSGPAIDGRTEDLGRYYFRIIKERTWSPDH